MQLQLIEGNAEIFGVEMALNRDYSFTDESFAVFTWYGCKLEMTGSCQSSYVSSETPMVSYVNTHVQLEAKRDVALANSENGPRIMVVGRTDSGKSTISRILASYAVRLDRNPIYVDTDVGQGSVTVPGALCAVPLDKSCLSVEEGFSLSTPLVYYFGHTSPRDHIELYKHFVTILAERVAQRLEKDSDARAAGLVVNTCGWVTEMGYDLLLHVAAMFSVDVVLVMGDDRLHISLSTDLKEAITVVKLPKSGGVVDRDSASRRRARKNKFSEYFYGHRVPAGVPQLLSPCRTEIRLSSVRILRAGGVQLSEAMLPIGLSSVQEPLRVTPVVPSQELVHSILSILHPPADESAVDSLFSGTSTAQDIPQDILRGNSAGFLYIVELDIESDNMTVLSPCPGTLPSKFL
eukprot:CAMPEP_0182439140 /NCGR_PEP_ID=MMETSP1167-20130531/86253_1 /TAXON_ID=2988 /ORGANISM="Mallomonas Sp, Strain CCMP3275" /LENGTH=405 /DNA_ID=CAMNT_0024632771 /DNA_START=29 /DNA_END=1243 /DNA_ORIENTATION=-